MFFTRGAGCMFFHARIWYRVFPQGAACMSSRAFHQLFSNKYCVHFRRLVERSSHITVCLHGELSALLRGH